MLKVVPSMLSGGIGVLQIRTLHAALDLDQHNAFK